MVRAINAYLARPGAVILSPLEAKARLTQLSTSKFPTVPFTIVPGSHPCCAFAASRRSSTRFHTRGLGGADIWCCCRLCWPVVSGTGGWLLQGMQFSLANYRQLGLLSWFLLIVVYVCPHAACGRRSPLSAHPRGHVHGSLAPALTRLASRLRRHDRYYGSVGVAGVADGSIPAASYTSVSCAILILILLLITVLAFRSMKRSGPPPLYLLDLSPVMKLVCLFLVSDLVLRTREPITVTGEFSPSYVLRVHAAVACGASQT